PSCRPRANWSAGSPHAFPAETRGAIRLESARRGAARQRRNSTLTPRKPLTMQRRLIQARIVNPLLGSEAIPLPDYATGGSAALDLRACLETPQTLAPGARVPVPTGLALNMMDPGLVAIVASRSGLSLKHGIRVAQGIGVIDADYHGEIKVLLTNDSETPY